MLPNYSEIVDLLKKGATIEAQEKIMELREGALELQERNIELRERVKELESQLSAVENWEEQKKRYVLVSPWKGPAQAYALKEEYAEDETAHLLCPNCFHNSKRVILTPSNSSGYVVMGCPACRCAMETKYRSIGYPRYAEHYLKNEN